MKKKFYHNGKLLLSGEYLILDGAQGLALATQKGGHLISDEVKAHKDLHWRAFDEKKNLWFEAYFEIPSLKILSTNDQEKGIYLQKLLKASQHLSTNFLKAPLGLSIETYLEFSPYWGLGSSSILICNLANLAQINPYELLWSTTNKASGYDIACALEGGGILYKLEKKEPTVHKVDFWPSFRNQLFFLYLGKKQSTNQAIELYQKKKAKASQIEEISFISQEVLKCKYLKEFEKLMELHELILSDLLSIPILKKKFPEYRGIIKSLGAWGGDFALITYRKNMKEYFSQKGFSVLISFEEVILKK